MHPDGALTAVEQVRGVRRTVPAWCVRDGFVRLGYSHTAASVQGLTVGSAGRRRGTAHVIVAELMTRNDLYPALTRAVDGSHAYVITPGAGDPHDVITPGAVLPPTAAEIFTGILARDGSARSVTTEQREAANPALRLGPAADAYAHAVTAGAETVLGAEALAQLTAQAEQAVPGVTDAPAWDTLRGHLAILALSGHDSIAELTTAAAGRELDTAIDAAAVLDWRLDPTGTHSAGPGPLPWLPAIPPAVAEHPQWGSYLTARRDLVADLAGQVAGQATEWSVDTAPPWAVPYLPDPGLTADLAVWRAAHCTQPDDIRPAGNTSQPIAEQHQRRALIDRAIAAAGNPGDGADRWADLLRHAGVPDIAADDYWPVVAGRLALAETAGLPVRQLLGQTVTDRGPLPAEGAAGALWWRLAAHIGADAHTPTSANAAGHRLRPPWAGRVEAVLGAQVTDRIVADRLWPTVVGELDRYARTPAATLDGHQVEQVAGNAADMLAAAGDTVRPHESAAVLLCHIGALTDPNPPDPDEQPTVEDPAEEDLHRPTDADELLGDPDVVPAAGRRHSTRTEPAPDPLDEIVDGADPFHPDRYAAAAAAVQAQHPGPDRLTEPDELADSEYLDSAKARPVGADDVVPAPAAEPAPPLAEPDLPTEPVGDPAELAGEPDTDLGDAARAAALQRAKAALTAAADYYQDRAAGSWVPAYLAGRGLDGQAAAGFGYAPASFTATGDHLRGLGFTNAELAAAGLVKTSSRGTVIDRFRDRAVTPITGPDGQVVGFIGRKPPGNSNPDVPKYLNSPGTDLYDKSHQIYGLDPDTVAALQAGAGLAIVEGPLDAAAVNTAHRAANGDLPSLVAVAPCGTALTAGHLATIDAAVGGQLDARTVVVAFDQDSAGRDAAIRAHQLLAKAGIHNAQTPTGFAGKDPADLLAHTGPNAVRDALADRRPLTDLVVDDTLERVRAHEFADRPGGATLPEAAQDLTYRVNAFQALRHRVAQLPDQAVHQQTGRVADTLHLDPLHILDALTHDRPAPSADYDAAVDFGDRCLGYDTGGSEAALRLPEPPILSAHGQAVIAANQQRATAGVGIVDRTVEHVDAVPPKVDVVEPVTGAVQPRPYADLPDTVLDQELTLTAAQRGISYMDLPDAIDDHERLKADVEAADGPATAALKRVHAEHRDRVAQIRTLQAADRQAHDIARQVGDNAVTRSYAQAELAGLGVLAGRRKAQLREQIAQLQASDEQLNSQIIVARNRFQPLRDQLGDAEQQQRHLAAAETYRAQLPQLRAQAGERDQQAVHRAATLIDQLRTQGHGTDQHWHHLAAEKQHRADHPEPGADQQRAVAYETALLQRRTEDQSIDDSWARDLQPPCAPSTEVEQ